MNAAPIGASGSAFARPAKGTFGNLPRNALRGPGYWRADASFFKRFMVGTGDLELRFEFVNFLNQFTVPILKFPLGFYMAAQGSLIVFVVMLFVFAKQQNKIDRESGVAEDE